MTERMTELADWQARATWVAMEHELRCMRDADTLTGVHIELSTLRNGRECHLAVVASRHGRRDALILSFGENRNSDNIVVQVTPVEPAPFNGPTVADLTEESYRTRWMGKPGDIMGAVRRMSARLQEFAKG